MRLRTLLIAALAAAIFQIGCDFDHMAFGDSQRFHEDFQYSYDLKPGGRVSVEGFNGSIEVLGWEKDSVQITGTKYASREENMRDIKIDVQTDAGSVRVRAVKPEPWHGNMGVKFMLRVPHEVQLESINTSNGQIRVEDIKGRTQLVTSNGPVNVRNLEGELSAKTSNGSVELFAAKGDISVRTSNGPIRGEDVRGALEATTSNSPITLHRFEPKAGSPVRLETSNGPIDAAFARFEGNEVRASTNNSGITIRLPGDAKARLRASTSNGHISTDFEVTASGEISKNHLEGAINGGGPTVHVSTSNGSVRIARL